MINETAIEDALISWVATATSVTTILANQDAPRPALPYITIYIRSFFSIGQDYESPPDDNGLASLYGNREFIAELNYFGTGGMAGMEKLKTSLKEWPTLNNLRTAGLAFVDTISELDVSSVIDTGFEQRQMIEFKFRYSNQGVDSPSTFDAGYIGSIEVEGTLDDASGTIEVINKTF